MKTIESRSRRRVALFISLGFRGQNFVPSSDIKSVRSGRFGLRTYEAKSDVAALD